MDAVIEPLDLRHFDASIIEQCRDFNGHFATVHNDQVNGVIG